MIAPNRCCKSVPQMMHLIERGPQRAQPIAVVVRSCAVAHAMHEVACVVASVEMYEPAYCWHYLRLDARILGRVDHPRFKPTRTRRVVSVQGLKTWGKKRRPSPMYGPRLSAWTLLDCRRLKTRRRCSRAPVLVNVSRVNARVWQSRTRSLFQKGLGGLGSGLGGLGTATHAVVEGVSNLTASGVNHYLDSKPKSLHAYCSWCFRY